MARALHPVPDAPARAVGYIRVSVARDDMVSPELQMAAITEHCERHGYVLVETISDLDLTARFWRRRQAERAVQMIEGGQADVIVLWKWSRLARNRRDWAVAVDRVDVAGGRLESATEPIDVSTSTGRLARGMLAEIAAFESERTGDVWREVHARRTRQGLPANGKARFGYRVVDGRHQPDPQTGPILAELYRRYVAGEAFFSLAAWLNDQGVRTAAGYSRGGPRPWSLTSLRQMLDTGFGAGYITVQGEQRPGVHEPVVDAATWTAYRAARVARRRARRVERSSYVLSGMVWCGCGSKMGGSRVGDGKRPVLRCMRSTAPGARRHPGAYVAMGEVEAEVRSWVAALANDTERSADARLAQRAQAARRRVDAKALEREVVELDKAVGRLTVDRAKGLVPEGAYRSALAELTEQRDGAEQRRLVAAAESRTEQRPAKLAADLTANWDVYDVEHRRGMLHRLARQVTVTKDDSDLRVDVTPAWDGANTTG